MSYPKLSIGDDFCLQLATVAILLYSTLAAIYFARYTYFNEKIPDDYDEPFITRHISSGRRRTYLGLEPTVYQSIMDAVDRNYDFEDMHVINWESTQN